MAANPALPASAQVAIIGGGVIGVSIAFHLAAAGVTGVLLLEANAHWPRELTIV
jgi:sarcosine oxidase subunit beta